MLLSIGKILSTISYRVASQPMPGRTEPTRGNSSRKAPQVACARLARAIRQSRDVRRPRPAPEIHGSRTAMDRAIREIVEAGRPGLAWPVPHRRDHLKA